MHRKPLYRPGRGGQQRARFRAGGVVSVWHWGGIRISKYDTDTNGCALPTGARGDKGLMPYGQKREREVCFVGTRVVHGFIKIPTVRILHVIQYYVLLIMLLLTLP